MSSLMKKIFLYHLQVTFLTISLLILYGVSGMQASAQDRLELSPESAVTIDGDSNQSEWTVVVDSLYGWLEFVEGESGNPDVSGFELHVLSEEIVSNRSIIMDRLMYRALKTSEFEEIVYELTLAELVAIEGAPADTFALATTGNLSIAGITHEITTTIGGEALQDGSYHFAGSYPMKMTDYGMRPPTALFGALHTRDDVIVNFDFTVRRD